ncbi:MAG: GHMP kinase [Candidatus Sedimenticola sp. (ex Thyasira tokunagai)]
MIVSQTPFRLSFAGGGTDLSEFYTKEYGAVLSIALKHHMYVTIHGRFENDFRISYSKTEITDTVDDISHDLVRQALRMTDCTKPLEITTIADVPAGTGLGSSSTLTVGLLNALYAYQGNVSSRSKLAAQACEIEIDQLENPIGKQDQYAAAYGGLNYIRFNPDHSVEVDPIPCSTDVRHKIESHSLMIFTAQKRSASKILTKQKKGTADKFDVLTRMRDMAGALRHIILDGCDIEAFGNTLHEGWLLKRSLGFGITNTLVDEWYEIARYAGAYGGKLLGAGGGGFLYLIAPPDKHTDILSALGNPQTLPVEFDALGSRISFISE